MKLDAVQIRVLGALMEKQRTVPDVYPLTLNALRAACNQSTNRDPVVDYDDATIRHALEELGRRRYTRAAGGARAAKYRHLLADTLQMRPDEQAVLAVLMLRGPQTAAELRQRTDRLHAFASLDELETTVDRLVTRQLAVRLARRPGQKEGRIQQTMGGEQPDASAEAAGQHPAGLPSGPVAGDAGAAAAAPAVDDLRDRVAALADELQALRTDLAALRAELGAEAGGGAPVGDAGARPAGGAPVAVPDPASAP